MSTKTTFKRIALVAVAALGLGVLSVAPSQAVVSGATLTLVQHGSATQTVADTTTAGLFTVSGLIDTPLGDSVTVQVVEKSIPSTASATRVNIGVIETTTATTQTIYRQTSGGASAGNISQIAGANKYAGLGESATAGTTFGSNGFLITRAAAGYYGAKFYLQIDSVTAPTAGTYSYTVVTKTYSQNGAGVPTIATSNLDVNIVVAASASATALLGGVIDAGRTTAVLNLGTTISTTSDSAVSVVSTASATDHAILQVKTYSSAGDLSPESVTATITGAGVICTGGVCGKSIKVLGTGGSTDFTVRADGTAGVGSIVVATTSKTFPAKTVNFFAKAASTFSTPSVARPVIGTGESKDAVRVTATDAAGNAWTGAAYIYATSAAAALVAGSETPVACTYDAADLRHECPVSGTGTGTATFKIIDAATVALATATSAEASVRVSVAAAGSVSLAFDKSSYVPGERAVIRATVLDTAGLAMPTTVLPALWATGAISSNLVLTAVSTNVLTSVSGTTAAANSSSDVNNPATAGTITYVVTMPQTTGTVTLTAKGGTSLATAGQVTVTASAEVNNPSADAATDAANEATDAANAATDAALAAADAADAATAAAQDASDAVAALSATVAKLVASLKAQITSLTNLVIKIQKKVKA